MTFTRSRGISLKTCIEYLKINCLLSAKHLVRFHVMILTQL